MAFYDKNYPGQPRSEKAAQRLAREGGRFQGFFFKADLAHLLYQHTCTSIRFYGASGLQGNERLIIAVGVAEDGTELYDRKNVGYLVASPTLLPAQVLDRRDATAAVLKTKAAQPPQDEKKQLLFASIFSQFAIEELLAPKAGRSVDGIGFYTVPLEFPGMAEEVLTHLGVSSVLVEGEIVPVENSPGDQLPSHIISDRPCPGYCVIVPKDQSEPFIDQEAGPRNRKYLVIWDDK